MHVIIYINAFKVKYHSFCYGVEFSLLERNRICSKYKYWKFHSPAFTLTLYVHPLSNVTILEALNATARSYHYGTNLCFIAAYFTTFACNFSTVIFCYYHHCDCASLGKKHELNCYPKIPLGKVGPIFVFYRLYFCLYMAVMLSPLCSMSLSPWYGTNYLYCMNMWKQFL